MSVRFVSPVVVLLLVGMIVPSAPAQDSIRVAEAPLNHMTAGSTGQQAVIPAAASWEYAPEAAAALPPVTHPAACGADLEDGCDDCCFDFNICCTPCLYAQADGLFWHRVGTGCEQVLVIDSNTGDPVLSTNDLDFNLTGGPRFLIGWQPDPCRCSRCCAWELSYFGLFDWSANAVATGAGDLTIPGDLGLATNAFLLADSIEADYQSEMHNVELNCIKSCCVDDCLRLDFLAGVRYISLDEDYTITANDFEEGTGRYYINADNDLFGVQLGGRLRRAWCRWAVELTGKAGVFYNDANQTQLITDFPDDFVIRDSEGSEDTVAMVAELGVTLIRPINDNWNLRIGYNVLGLGGVALAPNQLDFSLAGGTSVDNSGWFLAHGGLVGVETRW